MVTTSTEPRDWSKEEDGSVSYPFVFGYAKGALETTLQRLQNEILFDREDLTKLVSEYLGNLQTMLESKE